MEELIKTEIIEGGRVKMYRMRTANWSIVGSYLLSIASQSIYNLSFESRKSW